jgi:hypothetical protein
MKPILGFLKARMLSLESTVNGYTIEVMDETTGKYTRCFMHSECLSEFSFHFGSLKPNRILKIKGCKDIDMYGNEVIHIEDVKPLKKEDQNARC